MIMPSAIATGQRRALLLPLLLLLLSACGGEPEVPGPAAPPVDASADPGQIAAELVAATLGIEAAAVRVLDVEHIVFSDASLDCPEPDMAYAQVLTPGYRVLAEADGRRFDVRVSGRSGRICHRRRPAAAAPRADAAPALARARLAELTGGDEGAIAVIRSGRMRPDTRYGDCMPCPADARDCGTLVELELDQRRYLFRASESEAESCSLIARR